MTNLFNTLVKDSYYKLENGILDIGLDTYLKLTEDEIISIKTRTEFIFIRNISKIQLYHWCKPDNINKLMNIGFSDDYDNSDKYFGKGLYAFNAKDYKVTEYNRFFSIGRDLLVLEFEGLWFECIYDGFEYANVGTVIIPENRSSISILKIVENCSSDKFINIH